MTRLLLSIHHYHSAVSAKTLGVIRFFTVTLWLNALTMFLIICVPVNAQEQGQISSPAHATAVTSTPETLLERGAYLTNIAGCYSCHTSDSKKPFAGGLPIATPLGTIYSFNISPDQQTGIGLWTDAEFYRALHEGYSKDGSHLYPVMPYSAFTGMTYEDVMAIKAYLFSQQPISQTPPENALQFPYNYNQLLWAWKLLNFHPSTFTPDSEKSDTVNRGAYIGEALAHCTACHTPRTITMAIDPTRALTGSLIPGNWYAPNITPDQLYGIGKWTDEEIITFLRTGATTPKSSANGPMAIVIEHSTSILSDEDLFALVQWLRQIPFDGKRVGSNTLSRFEWGKPQDFTAQLFTTNLQEDTTPIPENELRPIQLYYGACASCHGIDGTGLFATKTMPLVGNTTVGMSSPNNFVLTILNGVDRKTENQHIVMPAFRDTLNNEEISILSNWLFTHFGRPSTQITEQEVQHLRDNLPSGEAPITAIVKSSGVAVISLGFIIILSWVIRLSPRIKAYIQKLKKRKKQF